MLRDIAVRMAVCAIAAALSPIAAAADLPPAPPKIAPDIKAAPAPMRDLGTPMSARETKDKTVTAPTPVSVNCGTAWTGWMDSPDTDANPCPKDCVRGERQLVRTHRQGDKTLYDARYQCHRMVTRAPPKAVPDGELKESKTGDQREAARTRVIDTPPLQLTGTRFPTRTIDTSPLQLTGTRFPTRAIDTLPLQLTGTRFPTRTIDTPALQLIGTRTRQTVSPRDRAIDTEAVRAEPAAR